MNWDDLRYVVVLAKVGSLARAARALGVDHTTVGRRVLAAEGALGVRLFTRAPTGYVPTAEAEALLPKLGRIEDAVLALERRVHASRSELEGSIRVTSGETFGACFLAPRLVRFGARHPGLTVELIAGGQILDLTRREAEIAVRTFRTRHESLVVRRIGDVGHALYASAKYLAERPVRRPRDLQGHPVFTSEAGAGVVEAAWVERLTGGARPAFVTNMTVGLLEAVRTSSGIGVLPRYLGDSDRTLVRIPMPDEPCEPLWLTVHRDLKETPRVRAVIDFLVSSAKDERRLLTG